MRRKRLVRVGLAAVLVGSVLALAVGATASAGGTVSAAKVGERVAPPSPDGGTTVVATDSNSWLGRESGGPRARAELFAVGPNGTLRYYNDTHTRYWDVDPVPGTAATVEYVAADHLTPEQCGGGEVCTRNVVERVNLTTGETTRVFSRITPRKHSTRWHDADRIDARHIVVADIAQDRVFVVNTTTGLVTWSWDAQNAYVVDESGGPYPEDWTHLNDVEVLEDGRIMVSLRNQDQVVFLNRTTGIEREWTLGGEDRHDVLYEQHNPDYIPAERGGPAVLVADSENNRVVEYQRTDGEWRQSWRWRDGQLQWPRDADRLPNGHTLVTDSNGNRVLEVDRQGEVVWAMDVAFPYESERLETGDESAGGSAAATAGLANRNATADENETVFGALGFVVDEVRASPTVNAVLYVMPAWVGHFELAALLLGVLTAVAWAVVELRWSGWWVSVRSPFEVHRR